MIGLVAIAWAGTGHQGPPHGNAESAYPTFGVSVVIGLAALQCAIVGAILRPRTYHASWGRSLFACLFVVATAAVAFLGLFHAPQYAAIHFLWLVALAIGLAVLAAWSAISALGARHAS
jgi:small-conductance mechanosensitive channel